MVLEATKGSYPSGALGARTVARPPGRSNRPAARRVRRRQCIVGWPASTAAPTNGCTVTKAQLRKRTRSNRGATRCAVSKLAEAIQPALREGGTATAPHGRRPAPKIAQGPPTSAPAMAWRRAKLDADEVDETLHCRQRRGQLDGKRRHGVEAGAGGSGAAGVARAWPAGSTTWRRCVGAHAAAPAAATRPHDVDEGLQPHERATTRPPAASRTAARPKRGRRGPPAWRRDRQGGTAEAVRARRGAAVPCSSSREARATSSSDEPRAG